MISEKDITHARKVFNTHFARMGDRRATCLLNILLLEEMGKLREQLDVLQSSVNNVGKWGSKLGP